MPDAADDPAIRDERRAPIIWVISIILLIYAASAWLIIHSLNNWGDRGSFGSMFGAVGTLFSGFALVGVVYAVLLQRQELSLQRQELELTRRELERAATAQEESVGLLKQQLEAAKRAHQDQMDAARRTARPLFKLRSYSSSGGQMQFELENHGAPIADLHVLRSFGATITLIDASVVESHGVLRAVVAHGSVQMFSFQLASTDIRGERRAVNIDFDADTRRLSVSEIAA